MSALRAIANDNRPSVSVPVEPERSAVTPEAAVAPEVFADRGSAISIRSSDIPIMVLLAIWSLVGATAALLLPLGTGPRAFAALGAAALLSAAAIPGRSTAILALSAICLAVGTVAALSGTQTPIALLTLGLWYGGVWVIQSALAAHWRSNEAAVVASVALIAVCIYILGTVETALAVLPVLAAGAMAMLGASRMAVKDAVSTAPVHYGMWWAVLAGCALAVQLIYPDLPQPSQAVALAAAVIAAGAASAWSLDRGMDMLTGLAVIAGFTLIYNPQVKAMIANGATASASLVVPAVFGAAVVAAGLALCVRGLKRNETWTMLLGAGAILVEAIIIARDAPAEPELAALTVVLVGVFATWLLAMKSA